MNQSKRSKGRIGSGGFNRGRNRGPNSPHSHTFINNQNDELKQPSVDIYQNQYLVHSILSLLGCSVEVTVPNGTVYEGVLKTVSQTLDVTLEMAHKVQKKSGHQKIEEYIPVPSKDCIIETLVIGLKNIVYIAAKDVDLDEVKKSDNFTDQAISSRLNGQAGHERPLQKWEDTSGDSEEAIMLEDTSMKNGLDPDEMFATNEKKYGVKSTYDHNMLSYTTPVEGSKELEDKAEILAREIEQGNNFSQRSDLDSGKTEEELFSAVVKATTGQGKTKTQVFTSKDENKRDAVTDKDMPTVSPPKPQRFQQKERDGRVSDNANKPLSAIEQRWGHKCSKVKAKDLDLEGKSQSRDPVSTNTVPAEHETKPESCPAKPVTKPQVLPPAAESGIAIVDIKHSTQSRAPAKTTREDTKENQKDVVDEKLEKLQELKEFSSNFKLAGTEVSQVNTDQPKNDTPTSVQLPTPKEQVPPTPPASQEEGTQQRDSPKVQEQQRKTESPALKTTEKKKESFPWNVNAEEFKPRTQPSVPRTPPVTPQLHLLSPTPTAVRPTASYGGQVSIRPPHQMKPPPRSPYNPSGPRFFAPRDHSDPHGSPAMSAATATGSPIIAPAPFHQLIAVPSQPFPGVVQQIAHQGPYMLHTQGTQPYMVPHSVGNTAVQSVSQTYQDNPMPIYASTIPITPSSPYQGSPQPSPTTQGQFLQYISQVMPQQQGSQPPMPQAVIASPSQHQMFMMSQPQQGGPQTVGMPGIPVSGPPTNPMIPQFMPGQVGFPAARKPQPSQWPHPQPQHPYPPSAT